MAKGAGLQKHSAGTEEGMVLPEGSSEDHHWGQSGQLPQERCLTLALGRREHGEEEVAAGADGRSCEGECY